MIVEIQESLQKKNVQDVGKQLQAMRDLFIAQDVGIDGKKEGERSDGKRNNKRCKVVVQQGKLAKC